MHHASPPDTVNVATISESLRSYVFCTRWRLSVAGLYKINDAFWNATYQQPIWQNLCNDPSSQHRTWTSQICSLSTLAYPSECRPSTQLACKACRGERSASSRNRPLRRPWRIAGPPCSWSSTRTCTLSTSRGTGQGSSPW